MKIILLPFLKILVAVAAFFVCLTFFYYSVSPYERCLKKQHYEVLEDLGPKKESMGAFIRNDFEYCHDRTSW